MASYNKVILIGNLTRDPEVRYTTGGTAVVDIGLAVNRTWFDKASNSKKEEATFVDVTVFGRTAEVVGEYCQKGSSIQIDGRLSLSEWQDKESGQKRSKLKVVADSIQLLGSGSKGGGKGKPQGERQEPQEGASPSDYFPDDDCPF